LTASGLLAPLGAGPASATTAQSAAEETTATPLPVTMTTLPPSPIPTRGQITISGYVVNVSDEQWTDINVSPFVSTSPITARDELAQAAASDPETAVGERLLDPGVAVPIGDLEPGGSTDFTISV